MSPHNQIYHNNKNYHFDVITDKNDSTTVISFAKKWLKTIGEDDALVTTKECKFCH